MFDTVLVSKMGGPGERETKLIFKLGNGVLNCGRFEWLSLCVLKVLGQKSTWLEKENLFNSGVEE